MDIGSDHAFLSIQLLEKEKCNHVINIEKNIGPLNNGIKNLSKIGFLDKTTNIHNDGLVDICKKISNFSSINMITISGIGGTLARNILSNRPHGLALPEIIVVLNNDPAIFRIWCIENKFKIIYESIIHENNKNYFLIHCIPYIDNVKLSEIEIFFGPYNLQTRTEQFIKYITSIKEHIIKNDLNKINNKYCLMLKYINKILRNNLDENK